MITLLLMSLHKSEAMTSGFENFEVFLMKKGKFEVISCEILGEKL